jgi:hypothetical protein
MNYQKNIIAYKKAGESNEERSEFEYSTAEQNHIMFKKNFHHSTFSCYNTLQDLAHELSRISQIRNKSDGSYPYSKKKGLLNTIKRCLYARYADNLKDCQNRICNIPLLVKYLIPYFEDLHKLSNRDTNITLNRLTSINPCSIEKRKKIFDALDHFSIIIALKKLYIIVNYCIKNNINIHTIEYVANSSPTITNIHKFGDHCQKVDFNSALSDDLTNPLRLNPEKFNMQILRLYVSVLRVYHSQNFIVYGPPTPATATTRLIKNPIMSTQTDLFKDSITPITVPFFNINRVSEYKTTLSPFSKEKSPSLKITTPTSISNQRVFNQLNYKYNNSKIGMKTINMRRLYRPIEGIKTTRVNGVQEDNTIPFFLDIFANNYYNAPGTHLEQQLRKRRDKAIIKNKILDYLRDYAATLITFGVTDNNLININNTYFMQKIIEHNTAETLDLETNYINPNSLAPPTSLFIKDRVPIRPVRVDGPNTFSAIMGTSINPRPKSASVAQSRSVAQSASINNGPVNNGLTTNNFNKEFPTLPNSCKKKVTTLIKNYLSKYPTKMLITTIAKDTIYSQICTQYAGQKINKNTFIQNLKQYLTKKI